MQSQGSVFIKNWVYLFFGLSKVVFLDLKKKKNTDLVEDGFDWLLIKAMFNFTNKDEALEKKRNYVSGFPSAQSQQLLQNCIQ